MNLPVLTAIIALFLLLSGCTVHVFDEMAPSVSLSDASRAQVSYGGVFECMESPGCSQFVQRCYDGICTPLSSCSTVHWNNGSACNCTEQIGDWTRRAKPSCGALTN